MNELTQTARQLPDNLEDLSKFVLIGREKLNAVRAEIRAIKAVELAAEVHEQKLQEAQEIAEAVLDAEAKLGELTAKMEKSVGGRPSETINAAVNSKKQQLENIGISQMQASRYETLAKHPEQVEKAKAEARAEGRIVTRQDVTHKIATECYPNKYQKAAKEYREAIKRNDEFEEQKAEGIVDLADAKQNKSDRAKLFEAFKATFNEMTYQIRHMGAMANDGNYQKKLAIGDKREVVQISERLSECYRTILKLQRITEEVIDEQF